MSERRPELGERASERVAQPAPEGGPAPPTLPTPTRPDRRRLVLHAIFGVVGVGALGALIGSIGPHKLAEMLRGLLRWLPLLLALEAARIACEAGITASLSSEVRRRFSALSLARMHLIAFSVSMVMPAGRAAAEATKAAMLSRRIGMWRAAAIATTGQSLALFGGCAIILPAAAAAYALTGASAITGAMLTYAAITASGFAFVQLASRQRRIGGFLGRRFAKAQKPAAAFQDALDQIPVLPPLAALLALGTRLLQVLQFGVLLHAVGAAPSPLRTLVAQGVSLVGGSAGDFIPGQLGATDGALALAAPTLGITAESAVAITVMVHVVQLGWAAIGASAPLWWRERTRSEQETEVTEQTGRSVRTV